MGRWYERLWSRVGGGDGRLFAKNVVVLGLGTLLGQGLLVLVSPLLTRLYTPEAFGALAVYAALLSMLFVVVSLRYELAVPLPEEDEDAAHLVVVGALATLVSCVALAALVWLFGETLTRWVETPELLPWLPLLPLGVFGAAIYQLLNYFAVRKKAYVRVAQTKASQGVGMALTQLGLGWLGAFGLGGLLLGDIVGRVAGVGRLLLGVLREDRAAFAGLSVARMRAVASRYRRFPLYLTWAALLNSGGHHLPPLLLAGLWGPGVAGLFAIGHRVIHAPLALVMGAVGQVFLGEMSAKVREGDMDGLRRLFYRTSGGLLAASILPLCALALVAPWLCGVVFGAQWREAGVYVQPLCVMYVFYMAVSPVSQTLIVLERQGWMLAWDAARVTLVLAAFIVPSAMGAGPVWAITAFAAVMSVCYVSLYVLMIIAMGRREG